MNRAATMNVQVRGHPRTNDRLQSFRVRFVPGRASARLYDGSPNPSSGGVPTPARETGAEPVDLSTRFPELQRWID